MTSYPPDLPTVNADKITVSQMLVQPLRLQRRLSNMLLRRSIVPFIFADGAPATGGAVIYDRVLANDLYTSRDVQAIEPGASFPIVDDTEVTPQVAAVTKRGGAVWLTYEAIRRNSWDIVNRKLNRLTNTIARKVDTVGLAVLLGDPGIVTYGGTDWSNASTRDPIGDIQGAIAQIDNQDLGYTPDLVLINPTQEQEIFANKDVREALPKENAATNPILSGRIGRLLNVDWIVSNRVPLGTAIVMQRQTVGSWHDEIPAYSRVIDMPQNESRLVQAAKVGVPVITDPKAVRILTGL